MKRALLYGLAAVIVIVVGAVVLLYSNLDSIVKAAVEDVGSRATKTKVTLDSVDLSPTSGEGKLRGFRMGNPEGFKSDDAMRFGEVGVKLDVASLTKDIIVIKEVMIVAPQVTYEVGNGGISNIGTIQKNVDGFTKSTTGRPAGGGEAPGGASKPEAGKAEGAKKVIIENLYVRDGKVGASATMLGSQQLTAPLPAIHLKDIGKDKGGATPAEVAEKLIAAISQAATRAASSVGMDKMMDRAREGAEGARRMLEGGAGDATKKIEEGSKGVGDAVKGLLGR